jgi:hypothetical protein
MPGKVSVCGIYLTSCISQPTLENISYAKVYCALSSALLQEIYCP